MQQAINPNYIGVFDWFKLFGSIAIVSTHFFSTRWTEQLLGNLAGKHILSFVPVFFYISGYFMGRHLRKGGGRKYLFQYLKRYTGLYFLAVFLTLLIQAIASWAKQEPILWKDYIFSFITHPFLSRYAYQLWFIPPLLLGILLCGLFYEKSLEQKKKLLLPLTIITVCMTAVFAAPLVFSWAEPFGTWKFYQPLRQCWFRYLQGAICVPAGMYYGLLEERLQKHTFRTLLLLVAISLSADILAIRFLPEDAVMFYFTPITWSFLLFRGCLKCKWNGLYPYRRTITAFSGLNFFLHIAEHDLVHTFLHNEIYVFIFVLIFNGGLAWIITRKYYGLQKNTKEESFSASLTGK